MAAKRPKHGPDRPQDGADAPNSPFLPMFEHFRTELDEHYDRRERVIKTSRDITALSKKIIFNLQRAPGLPCKLPRSVTSATDPLADQIRGLFFARLSDLLDSPVSFYRYHYQISPGIQEYIESLSFGHYLQHQRLISPEEVASTMSFTGETGTKALPLAETDYVGGLADLTGEMMRYGITSIATTGSVPGGDPEQNATTSTSGSRTILADLRGMRSSFEALIVPGPDHSGGKNSLGGLVASKMGTMKQSVEKVEFAAYGLVVRGKERPKGWVAEFEGDTAQAVES